MKLFKSMDIFLFLKYEFRDRFIVKNKHRLLHFQLAERELRLSMYRSISINFVARIKDESKKGARQRDTRTISIIHGNQTTDILIIIRVGQYSLEVATGTKRGPPPGRSRGGNKQHGKGCACL